MFRITAVTRELLALGMQNFIRGYITNIHINVLYTLTRTNMATVQNTEVIPGKVNVVTACTVRKYVQNWAIKRSHSLHCQKIRTKLAN